MVPSAIRAPSSGVCAALWPAIALAELLRLMPKEAAVPGNGPSLSRHILSRFAADEYEQNAAAPGVKGGQAIRFHHRRKAEHACEETNSSRHSGDVESCLENSIDWGAGLSGTGAIC